MTKSELNGPYFEWMYRLVVDDRYSNKSYRRLFYKLHDTEFAYTIPMDGNRAEDGIELRYRFGREQGYRDAVIANCLDIRPCSILEMMIALAIRCEEHIMEDPDIGNRTGQWFWSMLVSLGLGSMSDVRFDPVRVDEILDRFMDHDYAPDGKGGLFTIRNPRFDMRSMEIWYQMNCYLNEIIREGSLT